MRISIGEMERLQSLLQDWKTLASRHRYVEIPSDGISALSDQDMVCFYAREAEETHIRVSALECLVDMDDAKLFWLSMDGLFCDIDDAYDVAIKVSNTKALELLRTVYKW